MGARWRSRANRFALAVLLFASGGAGAQSCVFFNRTVSANFGTLVPGATSTRMASTTIDVRCSPQGTVPIWQFSSSNGGAAFSMRHATLPSFIPYEVSMTRIGIAGITQTWRITATVLGPDYENATAGEYGDRLTATILP